MADKTELKHAPKTDTTALVLSDARVSMVARGRRETSSLLLQKKEQICLARVKLHGKWGLIDKQGHFVVEPVFHGLHNYSEGRVAFCDWIGGAKSSDQFYKENHILWYEHPYLLDTDAFGPGLIADPCSWGFLDASGKVISPLRFEFVRAFHSGLAGIRLNGKWGFINRNGDITIEPRFDGVRDFQDGLCKVRLDGKHGLIDMNGGFVVPPYLHYLGEFSEGLASAAEVTGRSGYIDRRGVFVIEPKFARADKFQCGRARVNDQLGHVGYIDKGGHFVYQCEKIKENTNDLRPGLGAFVDNIAFVTLRRQIYTSECGHLCLTSPDEGRSNQVCRECSACTHEFCDVDLGLFLALDGHSILGSQDHFLNAAAPFSEGLGLVKRTLPEHFRRLVDGYPAWKTYGFVDANGQIKIAPQFVKATSFRDGRAVVLVKDIGWRMIDQNGAIVGENIAGLNPMWFEKYGFKEGLAPILEGTNGRVGFIDLEGRKAIEPQFGSVRGFANSVAVVSEHGEEQSRELKDEDAHTHHRIDRKYGYVDSSGMLIIPCQFEDAGDFQEVEI